MYGGICRKMAYWAALVPLPTIALALLLGSLGAGLEIESFEHLSTGLLAISGIVYIVSLILAIVYGFISKSSRILIIPTASLLLIALFVIFLPEDVREDPWRLVDVITLGGLAALNVTQIVVLRKREFGIGQENHNERA